MPQRWRVRLARLLVGGVVATADALGLELVDEHAASEIASVMHAVERVQRRIRRSSSFPAPIAGRTGRIRRGVGGRIFDSTLKRTTASLGT